MTKTELNTLFTAKVNNYLAKGYTFHLTSMSGSQGEVGKVDLTNGEEIIRILLTKGSEHSDDYSIYFSNVYTITVGRATDHTPYEDSWNTIWNHKLEVLEEEKFYSASNCSDCDLLVTYEEALANQEKHRARYKAVAAQEKGSEEITNQDMIKALLPYLAKLRSGCKSVKARHITKVIKSYRSMGGGYEYRITINRKGRETQKTLRHYEILKARGVNC